MRHGLPITFDALCGAVQTRGAARRSITAIAGPPGSGKSTLADRLTMALNGQEPGTAAVFPMDGYHFDDRILNARGWRLRKGAPHTFDVDGFHHMLRRLKRNNEAEIAVPVFDRSIEIARNSARLIGPAVRHLIVEGNYLLLDAPRWSDLKAEFDTTVFLDTPMETLRARLEDRWQGLGPEDRATKLTENDLPNAELVLTKRLAPEFLFQE